MNEFACVLEADGIRKGTHEGLSYISAPRAIWQMSLTTREQREAVLEIHDAYRSLLKTERLMSMDQMIADFGRYLNTHEWEHLRDRDGFDVIFIDEYHYFNRVEAMTLQSLFKPRAAVSGRWPLFMAYDLKQSTNDAAVAAGIEKFRNPGVGVSESIDLKDNYRSTPQISKFLQDLDGCFPAMDLEGEYETYTNLSKESPGALPLLQIFKTDIELLDKVFAQASEVVRELGGRRVAVLCQNEAFFDIYRKASRIEGKFIPVTSREDLKELQWARSRCVFSMSEYVAGLQFDVVFIMHVDKLDLADTYLSQGARRRYVSRLYLGASRAQKRLIVAALETRGGASEVLDGPLKNGSLVYG